MTEASNSVLPDSGSRWTKKEVEWCRKALETMRKKVTRKSVLPSISACAYRGPNGARCAIGALIPDDKYDPAMDRLDSDGGIPSLIHSPLVIEALGLSPDRDHRILRFLFACQMVHDLCPEENFAERFPRNLDLVEDGYRREWEGAK